MKTIASAIVGLFCALAMGFILSKAKDYFIYRQISEFAIGYIYGVAVTLTYYSTMILTETLIETEKSE